MRVLPLLPSCPPPPAHPPQISQHKHQNYLHLDFINLILEKYIEIFGLIELLFTMSKLRRVNKIDLK